MPRSSFVFRLLRKVRLLDSRRAFPHETLSLVQGTCRGYSGGPVLTLASNDEWTLVGIMSYGEHCGRSTNAGVYTRVSAYSAWITDNMIGETYALPSIAASEIIVLKPDSYFFMLLLENCKCRCSALLYSRAYLDGSEFFTVGIDENVVFQ